jgi:competence protein ComEC
MMDKFLKYIQSIFLDESHQLFLLIPVFMGAGSLIYLKYFFMDYSYIAFVGLSLFAILGIIFRKKHYLNLLNIGILCFLIGFCSAEIRTTMGNLSLVQGENTEAYIEGRVDKIIRKPKSASIIIELNHLGMDGAVGHNSLKNVNKVSVKLTSLSEIPNKNDEVYLKAILNSPTPSVMKGAYDFQKDAYFKKIGGYGWAKTKLYFLSRAKTPYFDIARNSTRNAIDSVAKSNENGQLMKALMLGEKKATPKQTVENFRSSGLAHLLSISGLHICLLFGFIFLLIRYLLALNQRITLNHDIKKISASIAILSTFLYVILVGYPMPTVRAFIMLFVVFLGILFNRRAISMRNVAIAGILIILFAPHSILSASFQMSFSAVIALVASYELISQRGVSFVGIKGYFWGVMFTSFIAIFATAPFAIYNFQNFSPYGIITNALVMPIVSLALMPFIAFSYILLPL